jgi:hypothetical protein
MSATTTQLLSGGEFCKLRYDTVPVKSASANVSFLYQYFKKWQILSCDTVVANKRYILNWEILKGKDHEFDIVFVCEYFA